jgi:hypothetical protein
MAMFPIYGVFQGDFVPHLVAVDTDDTMAQVAEKIAVHSVGRRVPAKPGASAYRVRIGDADIATDASLAQVLAKTGLKPLQWVSVDFAR